MTKSPEKNKSEAKNEQSAEKKATPLNCLLGATISGALALGMYKLAYAIAETYAHKPIHSTSTLAINIAAAVRTLVIGVSTLAAGLFAITTVGLIALAIQLLIKKPEVAE